MSRIKQFKIKGDSITLGQFLKEETFIASGGQAKWFLQSSPVTLNGRPENRRGKKLYPDDVLTVKGQSYRFTTASCG